jgi:hypothetical protein
LAMYCNVCGASSLGSLFDRAGLYYLAEDLIA